MRYLLVLAFLLAGCQGPSVKIDGVKIDGIEDAIQDVSKRTFLVGIIPTDRPPEVRPAIFTLLLDLEKWGVEAAITGVADGKHLLSTTSEDKLLWKKIQELDYMLSAEELTSYPVDELILYYEKDAKVPEVTEVVGLKVLKAHPKSGMLVVATPSGVTAEIIKALESCEEKPRYYEPNYRFEVD
jgi:hypothetical protein